MIAGPVIVDCCSLQLVFRSRGFCKSKFVQGLAKMGSGVFSAKFDGNSESKIDSSLDGSAGLD